MDMQYENVAVSATSYSGPNTIDDGKYETVSPSATAGPITTNTVGGDDDGQYEAVAQEFC